MIDNVHCRDSPAATEGLSVGNDVGVSRFLGPDDHSISGTARQRSCCRRLLLLQVPRSVLRTYLRMKKETAGGPLTSESACCRPFLGLTSLLMRSESLELEDRRHNRWLCAPLLVPISGLPTRPKVQRHCLSGPMTMKGTVQNLMRFA